jgi:hypothetical protein
MARPSGYDDPEVASSKSSSYGGITKSSSYGGITKSSSYGGITKSSSYGGTTKSSSYGGTTSPLSAAAPYGELAFILSLLGTISVALLDARVFHHALRPPEHGHYHHCDSASDHSSDGGDSIYLPVSHSGTAPPTAFSHMKRRHMKRRDKVKKEKKLGDLESGAYAAPGHANLGSPGNYNPVSYGNYNPNSYGNYNPGTSGDYNLGFHGNYNPADLHSSDDEEHGGVEVCGTIPVAVEGGEPNATDSHIDDKHELRRPGLNWSQIGTSAAAACLATIATMYIANGIT